mmetsp:Transcript_90996/g.254190  ORF Transcript_90996/g.254190 Transcript_90996/m.254190 type:complete len:214 (+) Transcript_90996:1258-1899(+)
MMSRLHPARDVSAPSKVSQSGPPPDAARALMQNTGADAENEPPSMSNVAACTVERKLCTNSSLLSPTAASTPVTTKITGKPCSRTAPPTSKRSGTRLRVSAMKSRAASLRSRSVGMQKRSRCATRQARSAHACAPTSRSPAGPPMSMKYVSRHSAAGGTKTLRESRSRALTRHSARSPRSGASRWSHAMCSRIAVSPSATCCHPGTPPARGRW